jgi:tetratricopeptide (TPR) repeat protein
MRTALFAFLTVATLSRASAAQDQRAILARNTQDYSALVARGDSLYDARNAVAALAAYESVVAADPTSYEALWKAARSAIDIGEFDRDVEHRTQLYERARELATRAVRANPADAEGHFQLSRAVGRVALAAGVRDKVRLAEAVRIHALDALARKPNHDGALHVIGMWNAEIRRLNGFQRTMAKTFMGGQVLGEASWDAAVSYMQRSVAAEPTRIVHRLDLGKVYIDVGKKQLAREQFEWIAKAPIIDFNDANYKRLAAEALRGLK